MTIARGLVDFKMNADERKKLTRQMGEAAAFAPGDPQRLELERQIQDLEVWAQAYWQDLLNENELLRTELARVDVPAELEIQLFKVPRTYPSPFRRWWIAGAASIAAAVLITIGLAFWPRDNIEHRVSEIVTLAVEDHIRMKEKAVKVQTGNIFILQRELRKKLPFKVSIPLDVETKFGGGLVGGQKCVLGGHIVAYSLWTSQNAKYSVFQLLRKDFDLPKDMVKQDVQSNHTVRAMIWTDNEFGYLLISDPGTEFFPSS